MALADTFQQVVDSLPDDWTDLEFDLRIDDESRYIDAALYLVTCNAQPYSRHDWHWRLLVAHSFGHAAAVPAVHGALKLLDDAGHHRRARRARGAQRPRRGRADVGPPGVGAPGVPPACARSDGARRRAHPRPPVRLQGPVGAARPPATRSTSSTGEVEAWDEVGGIDLLVVDLTSPDVDGVELVRDPRHRRRATRACVPSASSPTWSPRFASARWQAGFDLVVPRSRMAREGAQLVDAAARRPAWLSARAPGKPMHSASSGARSACPRSATPSTSSTSSPSSGRA